MRKGCVSEKEKCSTAKIKDEHIEKHPALFKRKQLFFLTMAMHNEKKGS